MNKQYQLRHLPTAFIAEEAQYNDGAKVYSIVHITDAGYRHYQYFSSSTAETAEAIAEAYKSVLGVDEIEIIPCNDFTFSQAKGVNKESICIGNNDSYTLMQQLTAIEKLGMLRIEYLSNMSYEVYYYLDMMIYEVESMAVKVPKKIHYLEEVRSDEWTYEYLIYPSFTVNNELLTELRNITGKELPINIEKLNTPLERGHIYRPFSASLFNLLGLEYITECNLSKGISNAILAVGHADVANNDMYSLHQRFRAGKKDTMSFHAFKPEYCLPELKLKELIEEVGLTPQELGLIATNVEKRLKLQEHKDDIEYEPIIAYVETLNMSPDEALSNYMEMETRRCFLRKLLYQLNMCWYDDIDNVLEYLKFYHNDTINVNYCRSIAEKIHWHHNGLRGAMKRYKTIKRRKK